MEFICKICGNTKSNVPYTAREMMFGSREEFRYFQCGSCLCLQIENFPRDIGKYYSEKYYSFSEYNGKKFKGFFGKLKRIQYGAAILPYNIFQKLIHLLFPVRDYGILRKLNIARKTLLLDVGCGNGRSFLYPLMECGYRSVAGCDPFLKKTIQYANGLKIENVSVFEMKGSWDIITYHHSFEHIPDPKENLKKVVELLTPGGVCILRIPTVSSYAWDHYRTNWAQLDAPRHYFLHSKESITVLAEQVGLECFDIKYDSTHFQFSGSEKYVKDVALTTPRKQGFNHFMRRKWLKMQYKQRAKKLNKEGRGDQAAFFLRKPLSPG